MRLKFKNLHCTPLGGPASVKFRFISCLADEEKKEKGHLSCPSRGYLAVS